MRAVKVILLAAVLCAVASAADNKEVKPSQPFMEDESMESRHKKLASSISALQERLVRSNPSVVLNKAFSESQRLPELVGLKKSFRAEQFSAEAQACLADLNFIQAATPIQPICLGDPAAVAANNGNYTTPQQVAGVCNGACVTALLGTLANYKGCLRAFGYGGLVNLMTTCQRTPECFSESVLTTRFSIQRTCQLIFNSAVDVTDASSSAVTNANAFCTSGCSTKMSTFIRTYPQCIVDKTDDMSVKQNSAIAGLADLLCQQKGTETDVCGVQLKALGRFTTCQGYSTCTNGWCTAGCLPQYTNDRMNQLCGRCMQAFGVYFTAFGMASVATSMASMCVKTSVGSNSSYCAVDYGLQTSFGTVSQSAIGELCNGKRAVCVNRIRTLQAHAAEADAIETFSSCAMSYRTYGYSVALSASYCSSSLEYSLRQAYEQLKRTNMVCAKSKTQYCLPVVANLYNIDTCATSSTCSASCKSSYTSSVTDAGCCAGYMDDYRAYYTGIYRLDTRTVTITRGSWNYTSEKFNPIVFTATVGSSQDRSTRYTSRNYIGCYTNDTAFWATWETQCQSGSLTSPPGGSLNLNLLYDQLAANPSAKAIAEAGLRDDVAATAGVSSNQVSGSIVSAAATNRQSSSTKAKFTYTINADSQAEADAAVASVKTAQSAGTLQLPAASMAAASCSSCQVSGSSAVAEGAAAPPTVAPVIGGSSPQASSASAIQVAVAMVAAIAAVLVL